MNHQDLKLLQGYNIWANRRIFDALLPLPQEQYMEDRKNSFGGLHGTMAHIVGVEKLWLDRFLGSPQPFLEAAAIPSAAALRGVWEKISADTGAWLDGKTDESILQTFNMKNFKGETLSLIYWQAFQNVVNHSSYHRGQIVTLLRQQGIKPPSSDLIAYYRELAKK